MMDKFAMKDLVRKARGMTLEEYRELTESLDYENEDEDVVEDYRC
jgi:hypothetical protein